MQLSFYLQPERKEPFPDSLPEAVPYFRRFLVRFHAALLAGDLAAVKELDLEADDLAAHLNGGTLFGVSADENSVCKVLARETQAAPGSVPLFGQTGEYVIEVAGCRVRIEQDGVYALGAFGHSYPGFSANVVDRERPFISDTGYRSFISHGVAIAPGLTPDRVAALAIERYLQAERVTLKMVQPLEVRIGARSEAAAKKRRVAK